MISYSPQAMVEIAEGIEATIALVKLIEERKMEEGDE